MKNKKISPLIDNNRSSNLELYKILMMLLIVAHHYVVNSGLTSDGGPIYGDLTAKRSILLLLIGAWGKSAINGFVMITGFFMYKKAITAKKFTVLLTETMFYRIVITSVFFITGYLAFSKDALLTMVLPVRYITDSFPQVYLVFFLTIPFLNVLIKDLSKKMHLRLLLLLGFVYVFCSTMSAFSVRFNYYSWFIVVYLTGAFLARCSKKITENRKLWFYLMLASLGVSAATVINGVNKGADVYKYVIDANKLLPFTNSITSFMFFKSIKLPKNRIINTVASSTYGVFLIHTCGDSMRKWLWRDVLRVTQSYYLPWPYLILHIAGSILGVYAVCTVIDLLRRRFLEKPLFCLWDKYFPRVKESFNRSEQRLGRSFGSGD